MKDNCGLCVGKNTQNVARGILAKVPSRNYGTIKEQIRGMGTLGEGIRSRRIARVGKRKNEDIRVALVRPLGAEEETEAVKVMNEPLPLELLASVLKSEGYQVEIFDQVKPFNPDGGPEELASYPQKIDDGTFLKEILEYGADVVGFTSYTYNFLPSLSLAAELKERLGVPIIWGGYHVSGVAKQYMLFDSMKELNPEAADVFKQDLRNVFQGNIIDFAVIGEGEGTILELMDVLKGEKKAGEVEGIAFARGEELIVSESKRIIDLDSLLLPSRESLDPYRYWSTGRNAPIFLMRTKTGCRFDCTFCETPLMYGGGVQFRSAKNIVDEIEFLVEMYSADFGVVQIKLTDEDFAASPKKVIEMCDEIKRRGLAGKVVLDCFMSNLDILRDKRTGGRMLQAMHDAGFIFYFVGIESMSEDAISAYNRRDKKRYVNKRVEEVQEAIDFSYEKGIMYFGDFMAGFPGHTSEQLELDYELLSELRRMNYVYMPMIAPIPGTPFYWETLWNVQILPGITYTDLSSNKQTLRILDGGDVKAIRNRNVQRFYMRATYEEDADAQIQERPGMAGFFAGMLAKISADYPENSELARLAAKYKK